jgi:hypothetical protein
VTVRPPTHLLICAILLGVPGCRNIRFSDLEAEVSPHVHTVVTVTWTTDEPTRGFVEFGTTEEFGLQTPREAEARTEHEAVLLGLPPSSDVYFRVVVPDEERRFESRTETIATEGLPGDLPRLEVTGDGQDAYMVVPLIGVVTGPVIIDRHGNYVWYHLDDRDLDVYRARLSLDGESVLYNAASVSGAPDEDSAIIRISLDGATEEVIDIPLLAHDFVELPDGTLAALAVEYRDHEGEPLRGDSIVEVAPNGDRTVVWTSWDCFDPATTLEEPEIGWTFANALDYDPVEDAYYVGMRNFSSIARIDRDTGACDWVFGHVAATFEPALGSARFFHQHQFEISSGRLLVFDNEGAPGSESRVLEYAFDPDTESAVETWSYFATPSIFSFVLGDVARMPGGDTLVTWSSSGQVDRVSPEGELRWRINTELGVVFGFNVPTETLYVGEADTDTDVDTDTDTDTDTVGRTGLAGRLGSGTMDGAAYQGTEDLYLIAEDGEGEDVCRVRYSLASNGPARTDCVACDWAFDLLVSDAQLVAENAVGCAASLGLDAAAVVALNGTTRSYGYQEEYVGHADVLMVDNGEGVWGAVSHATFDSTTGAFGYDWQDGIVSY